jgi:hypothetical protein
MSSSKTSSGRNNNSHEILAEFEVSVPKSQADAFYKATNWQLPTRPAIPPTLATVFREGEFESLRKMGITVDRVLHGEQRYRFLKDLETDTKYRGETFLASKHEKSGSSGTLTFYAFQTNLTAVSGEISVECLSTIVVRTSK